MSGPLVDVVASGMLVTSVTWTCVLFVLYCWFVPSD